VRLSYTENKAMGTMRSEERPQKAKSFLGDKSIVLPGYYGQRFAGRRQGQSEARNDYGYDVPRSEKAAEGMRDARWNSDFLQGGDLPEGWKVEGSGSTASSLGFNGEYLTAKCGPQRSDCAEWMVRSRFPPPPMSYVPPLVPLPKRHHFR